MMEGVAVSVQEVGMCLSFPITKATGEIRQCWYGEKSAPVVFILHPELQPLLLESVK